MKNLIEYIEECGEGCATPGNTMGVGNPMAPGAPGSPGVPGTPGTEPIKTIAGPKQEKKETSKRKKKKVTESILDDDLDINENAAKKIWVLDHLQSGRYKEEVDKTFTIDKDGLISIDYIVRLELHEDMPDWIQFGDVFEIEYILIEKNRKSYKINLPKSTQKINIISWQDSKTPITLTMNNPKNTDCIEMNISGVYDNITFPKNIKITRELNMERCRSLNLVGTNFPKVKEISLPRDIVLDYLKKTCHINSDRIKF